MQIAQPLRVNVPDLDLVLSAHAQEKPLAIGELQELGGDRGGGLEQRLRVVAAEQLDLPIPGADGEDVEEGVVGEEGGVGGDAVVEGQPRAHVLGAQPADAAAVLLRRDIRRITSIRKTERECFRSIVVLRSLRKRKAASSILAGSFSYLIDSFYLLNE